MRGCGLADWDDPIGLIEIGEPRPPIGGELLVAVDAAGIGQWDGFVARREWDVGLEPPAALSVEGTGRVVAVGPGVAEVHVGDAVMGHVAPLPGGSGFCADRVLAAAAQMTPRPPALTPVDAAALPVAGLTAAQALDALALAGGERLLITGAAGATGALALQLAARLGAEVIVTASEAHAQRLRDLGAGEVIDNHDPGALRRLAASVDAALVAARGTADAAMLAVRDGGRLCSITSDAPPATRGITSGDLFVRPDATKLAWLARLVAANALVLATESTPLDDAPSTFRRVIAGQAAGAKHVVVVGGGPQP